MKRIDWMKIVWSCWLISMVLLLSSLLPWYDDIQSELQLAGDLLLIPMAIAVVVQLWLIHTMIRDDRIERIALKTMLTVIETVHDLVEKEEKAARAVKKKPIKRKAKA